MSDASHGVDVHGLSDDQLADLRQAVLKEQVTRRRLDASPEKIEHAIAEYQKATGKGEGEPWEQPVTALQAYRLGAEVEDDGKQWLSTVPNNVWRPGQSGWRLKPELDDEGNEVPPPYVAPSGNHDSYSEGEAITWTDGEIYTAARDGVVHSPAEYPDDWNHVVPATPLEPAELIEPDPEPEPPEDDEPADPDEPGDDDGEQDDDEPAEPELDEWAPGGHEYEIDDYFTYNGHTYRVSQDHRSQPNWTPDQVASLYKRLDDAD